MTKHFFHALWVAAWIFASGPAAALAPGDLAGWWLSLGDEFPATLWIMRDDAVELRKIGFSPVSAADCAMSKRCSDAPLAARARLAVHGNELQFSEVQGAQDDQPTPITHTHPWTATLTAGNRLMMLRSDDRAITLAKLEPDRLRRLRAGMMTAALAPDQHWRCFLANAMIGEAAFAPQRKGKHATPAFLNDYLRIASYRVSLATMGAVPTADEPDAAVRKLAGSPVEILMAESFKDVGSPRTAADARRYRAQVAFIDQRGRGVSPQEANVVATALNGGLPVTVAATGPEFSALMRVVMRDAEAKRLFCAE